MADASTNIGMTAIKPVGWDRSGCEAFKYFLYNPETGEILSRTPISWIKIIIFYCIYYSCLAAFWIGCLHIFFLTVPDAHPRWTLDASIIGSNPGVGLRPSSSDERIDSSMFQLEIGSTDQREDANKDGEGDKNIDYAIRAEKFLEQYSNTSNLVNCVDNQRPEGHGGKSCIFDPAVELGTCGKSPYGYTIPKASLGGQSGSSPEFVKPCLFLKLNKIFGWEPKPINCINGQMQKCTNEEFTQKLQEEKYEKMSSGLRNRIVANHAEDDTDYVYIDCFGRYAADQEALSLTYFPENQGLPTSYFPYTGGNYHAPLVAIQVDLGDHQATCSHTKERPYLASHCGQLVHIECRAWFEGVQHSTKDKAGLVQFEVHLMPSGNNDSTTWGRRKAEEESKDTAQEVEGEDEK